MSKKFYNCMYAYIVYKKSTNWVQIHYKASYLVELPYSDNSLLCYSLLHMMEGVKHKMCHQKNPTFYRNKSCKRKPPIYSIYNPLKTKESLWNKLVTLKSTRTSPLMHYRRKYDQNYWIPLHQLKLVFFYQSKFCHHSNQKSICCFKVTLHFPHFS